MGKACADPVDSETVGQNGPATLDEERADTGQIGWG